MRCMQANLSYLAPMVSKGSYQFPGPVIMVCPYKEDPEINKLYAELPSKFGDWKGQAVLKNNANANAVTSPNAGDQQRTG
jgi:hypothetical protein